MQASDDCVMVDAVSCELFSVQIPYYQGDLQGILRIHLKTIGYNSTLESTLAREACGLHTIRNRERSRNERGIDTP
jgi:hypothetical protein